jgi:hypothetical protein
MLVRQAGARSLCSSHCWWCAHDAHPSMQPPACWEWAGGDNSQQWHKIGSRGAVVGCGDRQGLQQLEAAAGRAAMACFGSRWLRRSAAAGCCSFTNLACSNWQVAGMVLQQRAMTCCSSCAGIGLRPGGRWQGQATLHRRAVRVRTAHGCHGTQSR